MKCNGVLRAFLMECFFAKCTLGYWIRIAKWILIMLSRFEFELKSTFQFLLNSFTFNPITLVNLIPNASIVKLVRSLSTRRTKTLYPKSLPAHNQIKRPLQICRCHNRITLIPLISLDYMDNDKRFFAAIFPIFW